MLPYTTLYYFTNNKTINKGKWLKSTLPLYYLFTTSKNNTTSLLPFLPVYYLFVIPICLIINKVVQGSIGSTQNVPLKLKLTRVSNYVHNIKHGVLGLHARQAYCGFHHL